MSQSTTWDVLRGPVRDAVLNGRADEAALILDEVADDLPEHVRLTARKVVRRPFFRIEDMATGDDRAMTPDEALMERIETVWRNRRIEWTTWREPTRLSLVSFDSILKEHYTDERVSELSLGMSDAFMSMVRREHPAVETRIYSNTNLITTMPGFNGVVDID